MTQIDKILRDRRRTAPVAQRCKCGHSWEGLPATLRMMDLDTGRGYCGSCNEVLIEISKKVTSSALDRVRLLIEAELGAGYQFMLSVVSPEGKISMVGHGRPDSLAPALEYTLKRVQTSASLQPTVPGLPRGRLQ